MHVHRDECMYVYISGCVCTVLKKKKVCAGTIGNNGNAGETKTRPRGVQHTLHGHYYFCQLKQQTCKRTDQEDLRLLNDRLRHVLGDASSGQTILICLSKLLLLSPSSEKALAAMPRISCILSHIRIPSSPQSRASWGPRRLCRTPDMGQQPRIHPVVAKEGTTGQEELHKYHKVRRWHHHGATRAGWQTVRDLHDINVVMWSCSCPRELAVAPPRQLGCELGGTASSGNKRRMLLQALTAI